MNKSITPYQQKAIDNLCIFRPVNNLKILEIGANPDGAVARELLRRGAAEVIGINNRKDIKSETFPGNFQIHNMDARKMAFNDEEFDFILGIAVLEHLYDLDIICDEIYRVLKKNGFCYLHGGPLYHCSKGHHVWVLADGIKYEFNGYNPIPDWYHLIYTKEEMKTYLISKKNIPESHADRIVHFIYDSFKINRYWYEDFKRFFYESKLNLLSFKKISWGKPSKKILDLLAAKGSDPTLNYETGGIEIILGKED